MLGSRWLLGLKAGAIAVCAGALAAAACSAAPNGPPPGGSPLADAAMTEEGGGADTGPGPVMDTGGGTPDVVAMMCAPAPTEPDAGLGDAATPAACLDCMHSKCMAELTACSTDCTCGPANLCLLNHYILNYPSCPDSINALSNGNMALMDLAKCIAQDCAAPVCFPPSPITDASGGG